MRGLEALEAAELGVHGDDDDDGLELLGGDEAEEELVGGGGAMDRGRRLVVTPGGRGGRDAAVGLSLKLVESARAAQKPAMPISPTAASAPPATITSASPSAIKRAASPSACTPVAQAVTTAWFGPLKP